MLFKYFLPADPEPVYLIQDRNSVLMVDKINFKNFIEDYAQTCPQYFEGLQVGQNINEELSLFISNYNQNCVYEYVVFFEITNGLLVDFIGNR